ncbi:hypothetical protein Pcinc_000961 [Petrolisthes cinctipes]|uniref:THAP-type domain-containing protein n=1 Tax=Petrolisthes cinctipes TaxID=88211 RepID=A0AAE1GNT4_PETCI|nr:hypothetical protein Pcinc_000961 [Petrolisthes cinctipes]
MPTCSAYGCTKRHNKGGQKIRLFRFPTDPSRRKEWQQRVNSDNPDKNWIPGASAVLCQDHFEADQFEANRKDGWRKLKQNAVPTIFNGQQLEVAKEHSYAKYRCVRVETSDVGATEDKEDIPDTRNSTMNNTEQYHTNNFSGESKIGIWDNSEAEQHHNNFTNDSKINVWNSSDDRHINSPQPTDSYTGCMIKEEPPDSLPQNSPKHPPPTAEEDIVVVKEEVPDPSWSSLSKIGDGEETRGNIIANNTPSDIEFDLPLTVEPANPLVDIQKEQMAFLKTKIKALKNQLRRKNSKHRAFYQNIRRLFNPDQIAALTHSTKWDQNNWSSNTMRKAAEMRRICGALGYQLLLDRGYPLPCLMTLQTAKGKTT